MMEKPRASIEAEEHLEANQDQKMSDSAEVTSAFANLTRGER